MRTSCEITVRRKPQNTSDYKSRLVQVMACCRQATIHYLAQNWPRSMPSSGVIWPQWVKEGNEWTCCWSLAWEQLRWWATLICLVLRCLVVFGMSCICKVWISKSGLIIWYVRSMKFEVTQCRLRAMVTNHRIKQFIHIHHIFWWRTSSGISMWCVYSTHYSVQSD